MKWVKQHKIESVTIIFAVGVILYIHRRHLELASKTKTPNSMAFMNPEVNPFIGPTINQNQASGKRMEEMVNPDLMRISNCVRNGTCGPGAFTEGPRNPVTTQDIANAVGLSPGGRFFP